MLNKSLIQRAMLFIANKKIPLDGLVITDQSAMVMDGYSQRCEVLSIAVINSETMEQLQGTFPNATPDLDDSGRVILNVSIIKGLMVHFTEESVGEYTTVEGINVITTGDNIARLELSNSRDSDRIKTVLKGDRNTEDDIFQLRAFYRGVEDLTKLRIQSGQRVLACFKHKLGVTPQEDEAKIAKKLDIIEGDYKLLTDGVVKLTQASFNKSIKDHSDSELYIDTYSEMLMVSMYLNLRDEEDRAVVRLKSLLKGIPIWDEFLSHVLGCGPKMGAAIISEMDIKAAKYPSSFWKYLGLDVVKDPEKNVMVGRRNWTRLMEEAEFIDGDGKVTKANNLGYNAKLKSKLVFVMGGCMLKTKGYYRLEVYQPYKTRLENRADLQDVVDEKGKVIKSLKGKRHAMAQRYMVKTMIADLFCHWKYLDSGEIIAPYGVAKLGRSEHSRRTFRECLAMAKQSGGKAEDYIGPVTGEEPYVVGVIR